MKLTYRPEIDGLRAIAVAAVILYHAKISIFGYQPFNGGYIGVDIFFVISGYLITSIILKELVTTGSFSFKHFYERRIRRILPALLFVMLASFPFAWMYLLPSNFIDFSKSILSSLGFSSNFYFWLSGQQYNAESGLLKPFLHTWSLSVEEQFYILFPTVLLLAFKYFKKYLIHTLIFGLVISLGLADWGSKNYGGFNFYVLPTRIWELLAGSTLAYFEITKGHRSKNQTLNLILPFIGLFLIGHSILFFNDKIFHPSFYTLSPIVGVCLIIWFSNKNELITKILSTKLLVGIGLISYSLYLWHYPIFAFSKIMDFFSDSLFFKFSLIAISVIISIFSYKYIERPARNKRIISKSILYPIFFFLIIIIIFNLSVLHKNGYKDRFHTILDVQKKIILRDPLTFKRCSWGKTYTCYFNKNSTRKIFIIGDSHVWTIIPDLKDKIINRGYQFITSAYPNCFYFYKFNLINKKKGMHKNDCPIQSQYKLLSKVENSTIIFFGRLPLYLTGFLYDNKEVKQGKRRIGKWDKNFYSTDKNLTIEKSFKEQILNLKKKNKIILIYPFPEAGWDIPKKLLDVLPRNKDLISNFLIPKNYITTSYEIYKERTKSSFALLDSVKGNNIYRVYPHTLFCDTTIKNRCLTHDNKNIFYADTNHPSLKGAEMINDLIIKEIEKIELK